MRTASAAVTSYLATLGEGKTPWLCDLYTITLLSGTVLRWATADVTVTDGVNIWLSNTAVLQRSNVRISSSGEVDNLDVDFSALVPISGKPVGLMAAQGAFFGGRLQLDRFVGSFPGDPAGGIVKAWFEGRIAGVSISDNVVTMSVESDLSALSRTTLPRFVFQAGCSHAVYDANCGLVKATFTDAGTASGTLSTTQVQATTAAIIAKAAGYYALGVMTFTGNITAALAGVRRAVRSFSVSGGVATFTLALPLPVAPVATDTFSAYAGCDRTQATCVNKFNNLVNFRGFPHVPVTEGAV